MVSKASDDFPEPETPVTTVNWLCGISKSMFLRLWTRAPRTTILSVGASTVCLGREDIGSRAGTARVRPERSRPEPSARLTESFYYKAGKSYPKTATKQDLCGEGHVGTAAPGCPSTAGRCF